MNKVKASKKVPRIGKGKTRTIKSFFDKGGDFEFEHCYPAGARWFTVNVAFSHEENECDETEFDIYAYNVTELDSLFRDFVKENDFKDVDILAVVVVKCAPTHDGLYDDGWDED